MVRNLSPPNGTLIARAIGAVNSATFMCDVFVGEVQIATTWSLQAFGRDEQVQITSTSFEGVLEIGGTPRPLDGPFAGSTFQNMLTIRSFTEDLDRMTLNCLGRNTKILGQFDLRAYRKFEVSINQNTK